MMHNSTAPKSYSTAPKLCNTLLEKIFSLSQITFYLYTRERCNYKQKYCCPVKLKTAQFVAPKPSKYGHRGIFL